jgi:curli biogenesis system outer membrane secretion channel CsgG
LYELNQKPSLDLTIDKDKKTIAVSDFEALGFNENELKLVTNKMTSLLIDKNLFTVLERAKMEEILNEQGFQLTGCVSNECVVEAGQILGVQLMLTGTIGRFGNLNVIDIRIVDVETSKIVKSISIEIEGPRETLFTRGVTSALNELLN